jgi:hypothetical protein
MRVCFVAFAFAFVSAAGVAHAEEADASLVRGRSAGDVLDADYSSFLHGPLSGQRATMFLSGGWDAALGRARLDVSGWLPLYRRVSVVGGAHYGAQGTWRPEAGLALSLGDPRRDGLQGHLLVQYRSEGFTEPEGEIELTLRGGLRAQRVSLFAEVSYGQDPEARERDAEVALDATIAWGPLSVGLGARGRDGLGEKVEAVSWDLTAGPHLGLVVDEGHFLGVTGGLSLLSREGATRAGVLGLASYAVAY